MHPDVMCANGFKRESLPHGVFPGMQAIVMELSGEQPPLFALSAQNNKEPWGPVSNIAPQQGRLLHRILR